MGMSISMLIGSVISFAYICYTILRKLEFSPFTKGHILVMIQGVVIGYLGNINIVLIKVVAFVPLFIFLILAIFVAKFLTKNEMLLLKNKILSKYYKIKGYPNTEYEEI